MTNGTLLGDEPKAPPITMEDRLGDSIGGTILEDGFGMGDGGMMDIAEMPSMSDITLGNQGDKEPTPMDVDQPNEHPTSEHSSLIACI